MTTKRIFYAALLCACAFFCMLIGGIKLIQGGNDTALVDEENLPIQHIRGSFVYDTNDLRQTVGMVDYVFIGTVISNDGTHYENVVIMEDENGDPHEVGTPYTDYTVQVLENIKGNLQIDSPIEIVKHGGVNQSRTAVYVFENDTLPYVGETYIFLAYAQPDGSLLISGPASTVYMNPVNVADAEGTQMPLEYSEYMNAYENEIIPTARERYVSKYDQQ